MSYPTLKVSIAFGQGPYQASPTWTDVTSDVRSATVRRGKSDDVEPFSSGTATVTLDNRARKYDPFNTSSPYNGQLNPRTAIKLEAISNGTTFAVYRGFVAGWPVEYTDAGKDSTVTLDCFDLYGLMAGSLLPNQWNDKGSAYWEFNDPATNTTINGTYGYATTMTQTVGAVPFTKYDSLCNGIPSQSTHIGKGNTYESGSAGSSVLGITPPFNNNLGASAVWFMWAPDTPGAVSYPVRFNCKFASYEFCVQANGSLRVRCWAGAGSKECISTTTPLVGFTPHFLAASYNPGTQLLQVYIDGVNVSGTNTALAGSSSFTKTYIAAQVNDDIIQALTTYMPNSSSYVWSDSQFLSYYQALIGAIPETTAARFNRFAVAAGLASGQYQATTAPEGIVSQIETASDVNSAFSTVAISEGGDIYVSKDGVLTQTFRSYAATKAASTSSATFRDDGGSGLTYGTTLSMYSSADNIANDITVNFSSEGQVRYTGYTDLNGKASTSFDTDLSSVDQANALLSYVKNIYANPVPRISPLDLSSNTSNSAWATILGLELLDGFTLIRTPSTGSTITQKLLVQSIEHEITPDKWTTQISGTARYNGWFVIGTSLIDGPDLLLG